MHLPKCLQISSPYVSRWYGESGREYDFAVVRPSSLRLDRPAVCLLARHEGNMIVPLFIGVSETGARRGNALAPDVWEQALGQGMSHVHLRFEAPSEKVRRAEVQDLVVALRPVLNEMPMNGCEILRLSPDRPIEAAVAAKSTTPLAEDEEARPHDATPAFLTSGQPWFNSVAEDEEIERAQAVAAMAQDADSSPPSSSPSLRRRKRRPASGARGVAKAATEAAGRKTRKKGAGSHSVSGPIAAGEAVALSREPAAVEPLPSRAERSASTIETPLPPKALIGLDPGVPVALFADEVSLAAGADILVEALLTVCHDDRPLAILIAGEGPLKGELEARVHSAGIAPRVRFLGDLSTERFEEIFAAADFVVIPGRANRDAALAHRAVMEGKPVLVTHQACQDAVVHGKNGLVTYDNPGSIVWGLREFVHCWWPFNETYGDSRESMAA
jgi:hypothetical protein